MGAHEPQSPSTGTFAAQGLAPMLVLDASGRIVSASQTALALLRTTEATLHGFSYLDLLSNADQDAARQLVATAQRSGTACLPTMTLRRGDDTCVRADLTASEEHWNGTPAIIIRLVERAKTLGNALQAGALQAGAPRRRILVVDDEAGMGRIMQRILRSDELVHVTSADQARALIEAESFDVILCDLSMPGTSGAELFHEVVQERPQLGPRFVFVTGGAVSRRDREFVTSVKNRFLEKPFESADLRESVEEAASTGSTD